MFLAWTKIDWILIKGLTNYKFGDILKLGLPKENESSPNSFSASKIHLPNNNILTLKGIKLKESNKFTIVPILYISLTMAFMKL